MQRNVSKTHDYRERVAEYLTLMASEAAQDELGRWIDRDRLAFELCRIWFDDIYLPSRRYFEGLKGDYNEEAAALFRADFSQDELAELERFTRFLELRMEMLSDGKARSSGRMSNTDGWQSLMRHAWYVLDDLEPDAEFRRARLAEVVENMTVGGIEDIACLLAPKS